MSENQEQLIKNNEIAILKFDKYGKWGVTAEDHKMAGSTPPSLLIENPGKTLGEIMNEEDILKNLNEEQESLEIFQNDEKFHDLFLQFRSGFLSSIEYLKSINKLPKDFIQKIF